MSLADAPALYLSFASLHVLAGHLGASTIYWLRYRKSPLVLYRREPGVTRSAHGRATRFVSVASVGWAASLIATTFSPALRASLPGRTMVDVPPAVGWSIALVGLVIMVTSQAAMGDVFRIGQDEREPPRGLRRSGLHALSRNPIYVGSWTYLLGMTLWHPSVLLVVCLGLVGAGIHGLVRAEERFLRGTFGDAFETYARRTPRYLGIPRGAS